MSGDQLTFKTTRDNGLTHDPIVLLADGDRRHGDREPERQIPDTMDLTGKRTAMADAEARRRR